ncbi:hypothetical protein [Actinoplanes sp. NPDC051494]|uniref:hypothetical protein n=1 Tax=Actinoplanes sp. NPDC051494 TaxID=3363907 RepID=UPI003789853C
MGTTASHRGGGGNATTGRGLSASRTGVGGPRRGGWAFIGERPSARDLCHTSGSASAGMAGSALSGGKRRDAVPGRQENAGHRLRERAGGRQANLGRAR